MIVAGLMSGTSADGVDVALMQLDGVPPMLGWTLRHHHYVPYPAELRETVLACTTPAATVDRICALHAELGEFYALAVFRAAEAAGLAMNDIGLIGSHGQTVWHIPGQATLQIGSPAHLAERTGIAVISNFRMRDIAAGGQGAPLVAYVDQLLFRHPTRTRALQNIGGIGNVTFLSAGTATVARDTAFDTGPGNMLIDDVARRATGGDWQYDVDGALAARGVVHGGLLESLLAHPFLAQAPPKTTGREVFGAHMGAELWATARGMGMRPEDLAATTTMLTAASIADAYAAFLPELPDELIASGGGARNPTLMRMIGDALHALKPGMAILTSDDIGMPSEAKEAAAFAILGYESWHGRPGNLPTATGARRPVVLGDLTPA